MALKLHSLGANQTQLNLNDGSIIFFSYSTPVCGFVPSMGFIRTNKKWSNTTTRHINAWLDGNKAKEVNQELLDNLVK